MIIRKAMARDYDDLCALINEVDELHRENLPGVFREPAGPIRDKDFILGLLVDKTVGMFVAEAEGQLVGFVHLVVRETPDIPIFVPQRYVVVDTLVVRKSSRRMGIGSALMEKAHVWAAANGASDIELNVYEFNKPAMAFYRGLGYGTASRKMSRLLE